MAGNGTINRITIFFTPLKFGSSGCLDIVGNSFDLIAPRALCRHYFLSVWVGVFLDRLAQKIFQTLSKMRYANRRVYLRQLLENIIGHLEKHRHSLDVNYPPAYQLALGPYATEHFLPA